ncbi:MAG: hypothetical protein CMC38_01260 [Flavobacteriaceae bacterium]|nr:hypothetical protein [Flavobacteriaceae bacterium]|tara:strand:- start:1814 stop:2491 length:678 start_codon:yes stop_codon:yes gene_type:complete
MKKIFLFALVFPLMFTSCENSGEMSDDELIEAIINAENRISVTKNDLPKSAITSLDFNKPGDVIGSAELAPELGFEIEMKSWDFFDFELDYERNDNEYFTTNGRRLESTRGDKDWGDKKGKDGKDGKKKRGPCFKFKYPLSYTMGDGSVITGNDRKEVCSKMKDYFEKNGKTKENKPRLNFPVTILVLDDDKNVLEKEIDSPDILKEVMANCKGSKDGGDDKKRD